MSLLVTTKTVLVIMLIQIYGGVRQLVNLFTSSGVAKMEQRHLDMHKLQLSKSYLLRTASISGDYR